MTTQQPKVYRWRKITDISREHAVFELLNSDIPLLDLGLSNEGVFEVAFNQGVVGECIDCDLLMRWILEGQTLARRDQD